MTAQQAPLPLTHQPPHQATCPSADAAADPAAQEVRLVSEGFVDGVEVFTWLDASGAVIAEHAPLDPSLKQCGC